MNTRHILWLTDLVAHFLMVGGLLAAVVAPLVLFVEVVEWMARLEWPGLTLADGLALFGIERAGAETEEQRWLDMILALPLTVSLFATGILLFLTGVNFGQDAAGGGRDSLARRRARR